MPPQRAGRRGHQRRVNPPAAHTDHVPFCPRVTFGACQRGPQSPPHPLSPEPKALCMLGRCQIPLSAGPNGLGLRRSGWMLHLAAVWPRLPVRPDGICRDKTAEHKISEQSTFRKSRKYVGCLTSAAWIHEGQYFIMSGCSVAKD